MDGAELRHTLVKRLPGIHLSIPFARADVVYEPDALPRVGKIPVEKIARIPVHQDPAEIKNQILHDEL
jgi:hypothetical protein